MCRHAQALLSEESEQGLINLRGSRGRVSMASKLNMEKGNKYGFNIGQNNFNDDEL